ncbi:hypothetical protein SODALDRAFT_141198 [Sodiomyces alkalinus F11]|uniref:Uncharacterized protein n=1 Tax=Sodiomyces alkalinus (strain CBS 110278 / VKM F-3762 / F11) TaxID=1314773 RepID=A0A3N2PZH3_SODAK|nr:hypothetical protein SODALDRAFT_141198 [Sodiomyces alkalinus F11]ROT39914.1 hypothetical protein SODALDRAFT_141198 [Sodiomyces alkalinus F11]
MLRPLLACSPSNGKPPGEDVPRPAGPCELLVGSGPGYGPGFGTRRGRLICAEISNLEILPECRPQPNPDGTCFSRYVVPGDGCSSLGAAHSLTNA